jgi:hypothetical protein
VLLALALLQWYSVVVLPAIPEQLGGTKPQTVQLLIKGSEVNSLQKLGVVDSGTALTDPVKLLYESDQWITVEIHGSPVSIDRKNVSAMKLTPEVPKLVQF